MTTSVNPQGENGVMRPAAGTPADSPARRPGHFAPLAPQVPRAHPRQTLRPGTVPSAPEAFAPLLPPLPAHPSTHGFAAGSMPDQEGAR